MGRRPCGRASNDPLASRASRPTASTPSCWAACWATATSAYSRLDARNALYLPDAIEVHALVRRLAAARQLLRHAGRHRPGARARSTRPVPARLQLRPAVLSPERRSGARAPTSIATVFGMFNHVDAPLNVAYDDAGQAQVRRRGDLPAADLAGHGRPRRLRVVPDLDNSETGFSVFSPRLILRTDFVTHEQILIQYSRYWSPRRRRRGLGMFPYNQQVGRRHVPERRQERVPDRRHHLVLTESRTTT